MNITKAECLSRLKSLVCNEFSWHKLQTPYSDMPHAAILIPLIWNSTTSELEVLLTKRSQKVSHDKGHICFPGGMREKSDKDEIENALRESEEEIGLKKEEVEVVGTCVPFVSKKNIIMMTVLAVVDEAFKAKPNDEVEFSFRLPVCRFLESKGHHFDSYIHPTTGLLRHIHFFQDNVLDGQAVQTFGVTAQILIQLAVAIYKNNPQFEDFENEIYADKTPFQHQRELLFSIVKSLKAPSGKL